MRVLVCDVINYCARSYDVGKISVYDQIVLKTWQEKRWISNKFIMWLSVWEMI